MGNWELSIWPFVAANANPAAVYRSVTNPYVDQYLRWQRRDLYPGGLFGRGKVGEHGDDQKTARILTDFVRRGGRLGLVCDLYDRTGLAVPFFGQDAKTQAIAAMIARRVGSRIWMSRCKRVGTSSNFEIELMELRVPRTKNISEDIRWIMTEMQKQFEIWVRDRPSNGCGRTGAGADGGLTAVTGHLRVLRPHPAIFAFYDGRVPGYRFSEAPNWVTKARCRSASRATPS